MTAPASAYGRFQATVENKGVRLLPFEDRTKGLGKFGVWREYSNLESSMLTSCGGETRARP